MDAATVGRRFRSKPKAMEGTRQRETPSKPPAERREYLLANRARDIVPVRIDEIEWASAARNGIELHLADGVVLARGTLDALEELLSAERFVRIHRSFIVNLARVDRLVPRFAGDYAVYLEDGTELKMSRHYRKQVKERFAIS